MKQVSSLHQGRALHVLGKRVLAVRASFKAFKDKKGGRDCDFNTGGLAPRSDRPP